MFSRLSLLRQVVRDPALLKRDFSCLLSIPAASKSFSPCILRSARPGQFICRREFASSGSAWNFPARTLAFFALSSLGVVGGFYVMSYSMKVCVFFVFECSVQISLQKRWISLRDVL